MGNFLTVYESEAEWLKAREKYITGTGASAILGMNPYKTNVEYFTEKLSGIVSEVPENQFMRYGKEAEPLLRNLFKLDYPEYAVSYEPNNLWTNDKYPWGAASLDGWLLGEDGKWGILEIKTTEILKSQQREKWNERIPDNYYIQVLHYMLILEADFAILKAQLKSRFGGETYIQTKHFKIEREEVREDLQILEEKERQFAEALKEKKRPPLILPPL